MMSIQGLVIFLVVWTLGTIFRASNTQLTPQEPFDDDSLLSVMTKEGAASAGAASSKTASERTFAASKNTGRKPSKYAYAFLVGGGCSSSSSSSSSSNDQKPEDKSKIYNLYSVLVSTYILRQQGSQADMLLLLENDNDEGGEVQRMNNDPSAAVVLQSLAGLNVTIKRIPKQSSCYRLKLQKYRIFKETQYRRIMYIDSSTVMPTSNLDFIFEYSDGDVHWPPVFQENFVVMGKKKPIDSSLFMVAPHDNDLVRANNLIQTREKRQMLENQHGVKPEPDDNIDGVGWGVGLGYWDALLVKRGWDWNFNGAEGDDGFLIYWIKHVQKKYSLLTKDTVEHWVQSVSRLGQIEEGKLMLKGGLNLPLPTSQPIYDWRSSSSGKVEKCGIWSNFVEFKNKPWAVGYPNDDEEDMQRLFSNSSGNTSTSRFKSEVHYWFATLHEVLNDKFVANVDVKSLFSSADGRRAGAADARKSKSQNGGGVHHLSDGNLTSLLN